MSREILPITYQVIYKSTVRYQVKGKRLEISWNVLLHVDGSNTKELWTFKNWNQPPVEALGTFPCKSQFLVRKLGKQLYMKWKE